MSECPQVNFETMVKRMLDRNLDAWLENETTETRNTFLKVLGNCAILCLCEQPDVFEDFMNWLTDTRKIIQEKKYAS